MQGSYQRKSDQMKYLDLDAASKKDTTFRSTLISKNICIGDKRTSIRLEPEMWQALKDIARREKCSVNEVCTLVFLCKRSMSSLTASIRVFLMLYYRAASTEEGHIQAGHGNLGRMKDKVERIARRHEGESLGRA